MSEQLCYHCTICIHIRIFILIHKYIYIYRSIFKFEFFDPCRPFVGIPAQVELVSPMERQGSQGHISRPKRNWMCPSG